MRLHAAMSMALAVLAFSAAGISCRASHNAAPTDALATAVPPVAFDTTTLRFGSTAISVEVAGTAEQQQRGLGYRDALEADAGMLFDFHTVQTGELWMKGMRFPLDFVWIDEAKRVSEITADVAPEPGVPDAQLRRYRSRAPVRYVLELNAGAAARFGIAPGTQIQFESPQQ